MVESWKIVAKYYGVWEPPPTKKDRVRFLERIVIRELEYSELVHSLRIRRTCSGSQQTVAAVFTSHPVGICRSQS